MSKREMVRALLDEMINDIFLMPDQEILAEIEDCEEDDEICNCIADILAANIKEKARHRLVRRKHQDHRKPRGDLNEVE